MSLRLEGYVDLPEHVASEGGFDHAAAHRGLRRLYVAHIAHDALAIIDLDSGRYLDSIRALTGIAGSLVVMANLPLAGSPDVIFLEPILRHLFVAIGDPGLIEVFDVDRLERLDAVPTERGAHTIALDLDRHRVYAFLPASHRAAVFAARA